MDNLSPWSLFFDHRRRKKEPHIRIPAGFMVLFGVNYVAESSSIAWALVAHGRGANLPYFGKQGNILPYSPREQKRNPIQGLPGESDITEREKVPDTGLFSCRYLISQGAFHPR